MGKGYWKELSHNPCNGTGKTQVKCPECSASDPDCDACDGLGYIEGSCPGCHEGKIRIWIEEPDED